jgi:hypothetical protein
MKTTITLCVVALALVLFVPSKAIAQDEWGWGESGVTIYLGPRYPYGYAYPPYGYGYAYPRYDYGYAYPRYGYGGYYPYWRGHARRHWRRWH